MLPEITREELGAVLDETAAGILSACGVQHPPVDAFEIAVALELVVATDAEQSARGRFVRLRAHDEGRPRGAIMLRPEPRPERWQWTVAHEIGELYAHQVFSALGVTPEEAPPTARETVANELAGRLLLPGAWFGERAAACDWSLADLKTEFSTASHELIGRRMLDFPPAIMLTIFDQGRQTFRRANIAGQAPSLLAAERKAWGEAHHAGRAAEAGEHFIRVQAWPVHEAAWKREILRTEMLYSDIDLELASDTDGEW